jgi:hypothetical protein
MLRSTWLPAFEDCKEYFQAVEQVKLHTGLPARRRQSESVV